jgi:hypothetical protein
VCVLPCLAAGNVCIMPHGLVGFCAKALACANAGGVAAIITNNVAGPLAGTIEPCATTLPTFGFEHCSESQSLRLRCLWVSM